MSGEQLERRYRGLLRILPKPYREAREEELLSVLMEGATEGRQWPDLREALSLARLGMRVRLGAAADGTQTSTRFGETARAVGIAGSMLLAFLGLAQMAINTRSIRENPYAHWGLWRPFTVYYPGQSKYSLVFVEVPTLWLLVLALITVGWWRAARVLALGVFLVSLYLSDGTLKVRQEETVLAGVVIAALFAVRGVHARPTFLAGSLSVLASVGVGAWLYEGHGGPPMKAALAFEGWGFTENRHAMVMAALGAAAVGVVAYRSPVWPVALAVVTVGALLPVFVQNAVQPTYGGADQIPLAFLACALVCVAGLAVLKVWRAGRLERSESPASTS